MAFKSEEHAAEQFAYFMHDLNESELEKKALEIQKRFGQLNRAIKRYGDNLDKKQKEGLH